MDILAVLATIIGGYIVVASMINFVSKRRKTRAISDGSIVPYCEVVRVTNNDGDEAFIIIKSGNKEPISEDILLDLGIMDESWSYIVCEDLCNAAQRIAISSHKTDRVGTENVMLWDSFAIAKVSCDVLNAVAKHRTKKAWHINS